MMRHRLSGVSLLALAVSLSPQSVFAQDSDEATVLKPIIITATKRSQDYFLLPSATDIARAEELKTRDIDTVADLDRIFPDVNIRSRSSRAYANFTIRGQASLDFYNPSTQVYVDGMPQDSFNLTRSLPGGVESVELLYGPQGTLYGRGAIGGVINIVTRKPDNEARAGFDANVSNQGAGGTFHASAPIINDVLYGDANFSFLDGNDTLTTMTGEDVGGTRDINGQMRLRYAPSDSPLDVMVSAGHGRVTSKEEYFTLESMLEDRIVFPAPSKYELDTWNFGVTTAYDLGAATITALTGYQKSDLDRTIFGSYTPEKQWTLSQELRIASNPDQGNAIDYVAGMYYQHLDFTRNVPASAQISNQKIDSYALFGDVTWHVTDRLDISPGLRLDYERAAAEATGGITLNDSDSSTALSPKLGASYGLSDEWRVYGLFSTGFKAGGFTRNVAPANIAFTYDPQNTYNGETGLKYRNETGTLEAQLSAYYNITKDYQMFVGTQPFQYLQNVGEVTAKGIDLKVRAKPTDEIGVTAGLAYNHTRFTDYKNPVTPGADLTGNTVPYAPEFTANLMVDYRFELESGRGALIPYAGVTYVGEHYFDETNTIGQEGYALVDLGVKWELEETITAEAFVTNVFDKTYTTYGFQYPGLGNLYQLGQDRTIGGRISMTF
ncbi:MULTISPECIES: TonB-dependent receptor [unclassified Rhizobium]|uniref:TonB-dependent receptor n=1 Tax=unclassified Rhizobium TaxID=2613769 RepID=UPI001781E1F1|nr:MULTISPECIES: TonB-dependent receptor [unclassified Rhizobium]MBD8686614.1 TonB-dependent receptor [Rhizobium sp. CFBP 13644]MBD8691584.1 TonB-dependent receptor [Rhizobium sp. CFBP 13717]